MLLSEHLDFISKNRLIHPICLTLTHSDFIHGVVQKEKLRVTHKDFDMVDKVIVIDSRYDTTDKRHAVVLKERDPSIDKYMSIPRPKNLVY